MKTASISTSNAKNKLKRITDYDKYSRNEKTRKIR